MRHVALLLLIAGLSSSPMASAGEHEQSAASAPVRTGKERLIDKGSDEQRIDDCKVPSASGLA